MTAAEAGQPFEVEIGIGTVRGLRFGRAGGRRVLALHGWLDNAASFVPLAAHLDGLDLVAPDLPGHGRSVHMPVGTDYTFVGAVHQVLDIADALGWERFALLGHSMGAGIASLVAAAIPERIERLVAIEALGALPEPESGTVPRLREAVAASRGHGTRPLRVLPGVEAPVRARMRVNGLSVPVARLLVERGVRAVDGGLVWCSDPRLTIPTAVRMTPGQVDALIAGIECPTRVIYADPPQPYLPEPDRTRRAGLLPDGELTVISGGHHLHMEQPAEVASAIGDFLLR